MPFIPISQILPHPMRLPGTKSKSTSTSNWSCVWYVPFSWNSSLGLTNMEIPSFWDITPCSPLKINQRFAGICRLYLQGRRIIEAAKQETSTKEVVSRACWLMLVSWTDYSSTLKTEATCSYETWVDCQRTSWRYIPEGNHRFEHLISHMV
jgi:hypothetical protein